MKRLLIAGISALMLSACTNPSPPRSDNTDTPIQDQLFGVGPVNHKWLRSDEGVRYNFDMNQNPQEIRNLSEEQYSISDDQDKIRHLVQTESGFEPRMVAIIGKTAHIHVQADESVTNDDLNDLRTKLQIAMPRYEIRIYVQDEQ